VIINDYLYKSGVLHTRVSVYVCRILRKGTYLRIACLVCVHAVGLSSHYFIDGISRGGQESVCNAD
jgi:hypothetical protein